ncbi:T9SS type A sorting domain-containing protein [Formosa algae]|uniref:Ig-like domain-containing protein n=1 Tax=Formosa algae TaxID=225843 RepID=A0A9X0YHV6_9FLAO|nr:T9SS type A sorting domain-containing protein [Formosa algae]MBP1838555.1 hypothetical protein [Formosa algae]MDQ0335055.1 hypothetical protein [Formosa algae]OEI79607.1 hypothetical protein AST99_13640 [Formosa algae]
MSRKITQTRMINPLKYLLLAFVFTAFANRIQAQTVTEVYPSRVTTKSQVTLVGSGFTSATTISVSGVSISDKTLVSETEMTFEISYTGTSDKSAELNVGGTATGFSLDYVAPTSKTLKNGTSSNVTKITEIFTTYNGFWRSSDWKADPTNQDLKPNSSHDLLAFTYDGVTYSTGVDDDLLTANRVTFDSQLFYAYSTNGVDGITHDGNYLAMGDLVDGEVGEGTSITSPEILSASIYEVLIDGTNGLDIGTGVTNFNQLSDVEFYSSGGQLGAINDAAPDFLISQIAQAGSTDIYYYADNSGNVVGRPIKLTIVQEEDTDGDALLANWRLDLYSFASGINYGLAEPKVRAFSSNEERPLRMAAFRFEDFGITADNIADINNINMVAGGTADLAFLAYNRGSFDIKTPVFDQYPVSSYVCDIPSTKNITFAATAEVSGTATGAAEETLTYQWYKYNTAIPGATSNTYTITDDIELDDIGTYKLLVSNSFGSVIVPVSLIQGGTPVFWDGSNWQLPPSYIEAGISVDPLDRRFVFSDDYSEATDLEGCDCIVPSGSNATIPSGSVLKLRNNVTVESGASLTIEDSASLIQVNEATDDNMNSGDIILKREAAATDDFIVWSTPVESFNIEDISTPYTTTSYSWDVNNEWAAFSGIMADATGYAVQVPAENEAGFTANFIGTPRNGTTTTDVVKSSDASIGAELKHWNLIGNPYPSALSADEFLATNNLLIGSIRLWANNLDISNVSSPLVSTQYESLSYNYNEEYISYNATGANPPQTTEGYISSGQGFFVQVDDAASAGEVVFTNNMRYDDSGLAYDNSHFFKTNVPTPNTDGKQLVWLSLIDASNASASALVGYVNGATLGKDKLYDAYSDVNTFDIYTMVEDSKMVIQGRPLPFDDTEDISVGVSLPSAGSYKIAIGDLSGSAFIDDAQDIYLEDTVLGMEHDLRSSPYEFTGEQGEFNDRFVIHFEKTLSVSDNATSQTFVYINNNVLNIKSFKNIKAVNVYDLTGKQVVSFKTNNQGSEFSESFKFSRGVYLTSVVLEGDIVVTKKVIN